MGTGVCDRCSGVAIKRSNVSRYRENEWGREAEREMWEERGGDGGERGKGGGGGRGVGSKNTWWVCLSSNEH